MFKIGDKIKVLVNHYVGCMPNGDGPKVGDVLEVVDKNKCTTLGNWIDKYTAEVEQVNLYGNTEFSLLENIKPRFSIGDRVISVKNTPFVEEGFIGIVSKIFYNGSCPISVRSEVNENSIWCFEEDELALLSGSNNFKDIKVRNDSIGLSLHGPLMNITPADIKGIARPILEERKIGKVKMELFDEGFPNAIMEIARVMTWAAEHKGYKPHDWKSLPNADTEFSAAASRHKVKGFIQKVEGVEPLQRTDEESKISHLAHQAFNVLAELELVLTGVIK